MKAFVVIALCVLFSIQLYAQDKIFLESGDTLKVVISNRDKKNISYVMYDDPEMLRSSVPVTKVSKIQFDNGKVLDFHKSRYPGTYVGLILSDPVPVSDFANKSLTGNQQSGFATGNKGALGMEGRMRLYKFIGLHSTLNVGAFGVDQQTYFQKVNNSRNANGYYVNGSLSSYRFATFALGADLGLKLGSRFMLFVPVEALLMGMKTEGDDNIYYYNNMTNKQTADIQRSTKGSGLGYAVGLKFEVRILRNFSTGLMVKMHNAYLNQKVTSQEKSSGADLSYTWNQHVTYTQFALTINYHFKP